MTFVVFAVAWLVLAVIAALAVGRGVRLADRHAPAADHLAGLPLDLTVDRIVG